MTLTEILIIIAIVDGPLIGALYLLWKRLMR